MQTLRATQRRPRRALPIRWRLTLWYVGVLLLVVLLLGGALYVGLRVLLYNALDDRLRNQATTTSTVLGTQVNPDDEIEAVLASLVLPTVEDDYALRLRAPDGSIVASGGEDPENLGWNAAGIDQALSGTTDVRWLSFDGNRLRVVAIPLRINLSSDGNPEPLPTSTPDSDDDDDDDDDDNGNDSDTTVPLAPTITSDDTTREPDDDDTDDDNDDDDDPDTVTLVGGAVPGQQSSGTRVVGAQIASRSGGVAMAAEDGNADSVIIGVLEVATESDVDDTLNNVLRLLALLTPVLLIAATGGGVWLAGRALRPIDHLTRLASGIDERDLTTRLTLDLPNDELGRLAATINAMLDRIEHAFLRQRQFTADAAHELRTPLAMLQSQLELALNQARTPERDSAAFAALLNDVERLARLVSALLLLSQDDVRGMHLEREEIDLGLLLELVAEQYAPLAADANVALQVDTVPAEINADEDRLLQVIINLLDNALRHAPRGSTITLSCRADARSVSFAISDQGPGIDPSQHAAIFERFVRLDAGRARHEGGIGLGLSMVRSITEAHGGHIEVESTPGAGATFRVTLPRA